MAVANRLNRVVALIYRLPAAWHTPLLSRLFGSQVKLAGTARVRVHAMTRTRASLSIANRRPVQTTSRVCMPPPWPCWPSRPRVFWWR